MKEKVKLGYIGLGRRGWGMLKYAICKMADVEITVICDLDEKKKIAANGINIIKNSSPIAKTSFKKYILYIMV